MRQANEEEQKETAMLSRLHRTHRNMARRARTKGQAVVETALCGVVVALLLAGIVDFGRAYYTDVIVTNMAAEGAAYAAVNPDYDSAIDCTTDPNWPWPPPSTTYWKPVQYRVKNVAKEHGLVIDVGDTSTISTTITVPGGSNPTGCTNRCANNTIRVQVIYTIHDLFLPRLLGMNNITITESASQQIMRDADTASCSSP